MDSGRELASKPAISFKKCWGGYRRRSPRERGLGFTVICLFTLHLVSLFLLSH